MRRIPPSFGQIVRQVSLHVIDRLCAALRAEPGELLERVAAKHRRP